MEKIVLGNKEIRFVKVLSNNTGMITYLGEDDSDNKFVLKMCSWNDEKPFSETLETYRTYYSRDLMTSAWYGHEEIDLTFEQIQAILVKQAQYVSNTSQVFNSGKVEVESCNNGIVQVRPFINGASLTIEQMRREGFIWEVVKQLLVMLKHRQHGDIKEEHIIYNTSTGKISLIDPAVMTDVFLTNKEYYPIVPPLFEVINEEYISFPDQLALGILLYKTLTGKHPWSSFVDKPFWQKCFGNGIGNYSIDELYSVLTVVPPFHEMTVDRKTHFTNDYVAAIHNELFKAPTMEKDLFVLVNPQAYNSDLTDSEAELCMSLLQTYHPASYYYDMVRNL